jgi:nucleotide-binding universal stress UspA family protein
MYKTILVPVDLSHADVGERILKLARRVGGNDAIITLLNVIEEVPGYVSVELPAGLMAKNIEKAKTELAALAAKAGADHEVRTGHSSTTILDHAQRIGADLIVIGSHRPGLQDYFLGSTAARVVRHAQCAVLVDR